MFDHWRHAHEFPAEHLRRTDPEEGAYATGWVLSCAAVLGTVLLVWQFNF